MKPLTLAAWNRLATLYPDTLMVGMELREKVSTYVKERIGEEGGGYKVGAEGSPCPFNKPRSLLLGALRREHPGQYGNITCLRSNAMKYLPHYFQKGQLTKMFFLFPVRTAPAVICVRISYLQQVTDRPSQCLSSPLPFSLQDPHFKTANHRRRIINTTLITEYAYFLAPGGMLYTITDVKDLGDWMVGKRAGIGGGHKTLKPIKATESLLSQYPVSHMLPGTPLPPPPVLQRNDLQPNSHCPSLLLSA